MTENGHVPEMEIEVVDLEAETPPARPRSGAPAEAPEMAPDDFEALLRLLVGGSVEGAQELLARVRAWEAAHTTEAGSEAARESDAEVLRYAAVGMVFTLARRGRRRTRQAVSAGRTAARVGRKVARPFTPRRLLRPVQRRVERLATRGAKELAEWVSTGRVEEQRGRAMARDLFASTVDETVAYVGVQEAVNGIVDAQIEIILQELAEDPRLAALIEAQVNPLLDELPDNPHLQGLVSKVVTRVLAELAEDENVQALIRKQGDAYIEYLEQENPESVQTLIQGQSVGLAGEVLDEVRSRTVSADTVTERLVRSIFRRRPRAEIPPPPPEVQAAALPSRPGHEPPAVEPDVVLIEPAEEENA